MSGGSAAKPALPRSVWRHIHDCPKKDFYIYLLPRPDKPSSLRITPYAVDSRFLNNIEAAYLKTHCVGIYTPIDPDTPQRICDDIEFLRQQLSCEILEEGE